MSNLSKLIELRNEIKIKEYEVRKIMPDAILEALDNLSESEATNQVALKNKNGKAVVVYRKRFPTIKQSKKLEELEALIVNAQSNLATLNKTELDKIEKEIKEHEEAIEALKQKQNEILNSKYIIRLKRAYMDTQETESWLEPTLSIYLT
jgi:hypothetical protein